MIKLKSKDFHKISKALEIGEAFFEVIKDNDDVYLSLLPLGTMNTMVNNGQEIGYIQSTDNEIKKGIKFTSNQVLHIYSNRKSDIVCSNYDIIKAGEKCRELGTIT